MYNESQENIKNPTSENEVEETDMKSKNIKKFLIIFASIVLIIIIISIIAIIF